MRTWISAFTLGLVVAAAAPSLAESPKRPARENASARIDWKRVERHLREHQSYPATKAELVASCNDLMDFSGAEKKWFADTLPEGTYKSAADVLKALRPNK